MALRRLPAALIATALLALSACSMDAPIPTPPVPTASEAPTEDPTITFDLPASGATISTPIEASGTANTFEAALTLEAVDAGGNTLCVRHIMATSGSGTPGTWQTMLGLVPPPTDTAVTLRAYESSADDGSEVNVVERPVTLSSEHPPIVIEAPECGATVAPGATLTVSGQALVFEAALTVELRDASGTQVVTNHVMAASGVEESPWSTELVLPAGLVPGFYDLVAYNESAEDGSIQNEFPIQIRVE